MSPRRPLVAALCLALAPAALAAQDAGSSVLRGAPQAVSFSYGQTGAKTTVSQIAVPIYAAWSVTDHLTLDVGTAYAQSKYTSPGGTSQSISGLTDTQLRGAYSFPDIGLVLTAGLNLPTGMASVPKNATTLGGLVGVDLLGFPVPAYGSGFAFTGGLAVTRPAGDWTIGGGASVRAAGAFSPVADSTARFTPGTEYRASLGADRATGDGHLAFALTYSGNGGQQYNTLPVSSGNRLLFQGAWTTPLGGGKPDLFLSAWNLSIGNGTFNATPIAGQNLTNLQVALGFHAGSATIEPNVEGRVWRAGDAGNGVIGFVGLRTRIPAGAVTFFPGASYGFGSIKTNAGALQIDNGFTGYRVSLGASFVP